MSNLPDAPCHGCGKPLTEAIMHYAVVWQDGHPYHLECAPARKSNLPNYSRLYEELRREIDGGSESMTHEGAIAAIKQWQAQGASPTYDDGHRSGFNLALDAAIQECKTAKALAGWEDYDEACDDCIARIETLKTKEGK